MNFTGSAVVAGVAGWPIGHSRSPRIHNFWLGKYEIDGVYIPLSVPPDRIDDVLRMLSAMGIRGLNVTVPHKQAAFAAMDAIDFRAERMRAVNTVTVRDDGSLYGENTDGFGFMEALSGSCPEWRAGSGPAVVIGAGGAARAIVASLQDAGAPDIRVVNRTWERAQALETEFGTPVRAVPWRNRTEALEGAELLVNATSLGMRGKSFLEIDLSPLPVAAIVYDIVYAPLVTPLLKAARSRGNATVDGLGMLLHQARPGFRSWFGRDPAVDQALRDHVLADL